MAPLVSKLKLMLRLKEQTHVLDNANPGNRKAPFAVYYFAVEINGVEYPFQSVSGLTIEQTVVEIQEGGFNNSPRRLPGPVKSTVLSLKKGFCYGDSDLYQLRLKFMNDLPIAAASTSGKGWKGPSRFSGTITQKGPRGTEAKWFFVNGWISKWSGPDLDASKNEISIETTSIEIAHEGLYMLPMGGAQDDSSDSSDSVGFERLERFVGFERLERFVVGFERLVVVQ